MLLAVNLAACGAEPEPPLRIGTVFWPSSELLFRAQARGWLDPSEFRLVEFVDDGEAVRALRNQAVSAAWLTLDEVLVLAQTGAVDPVVLFVADESRGGDAVLAHGDILTLADLKDRRVAAQLNSVNAFLLDRALRETGLSARDVQLVNLPPYRQLRAFQRREVDAVVTYEPVRSQILDAGGVEIFSSASMPFEVLRVLAIRRDYLEAHPARADTLCEGWRRAYADIQESPDARAWVAHRLSVTPAVFDGMLDRMRLIGLGESRMWLTPPRTRLLSSAARLQADLLTAGLMSDAVEIDALLEGPPGLRTSRCRG